LRVGVCHAKVGDSVGQGSYGCILLCGIHAVAVLRGQDGREQCNFDGGFPKGTERGEVHCVGWGVAACNPGLDSSAKKPVQWMTEILMSRMSLLGMGCLARLANIASRKRHATSSLNPCKGCHSKAMAVQLDSQLSEDMQLYFVTNQVNILQNMEFGFSIRICS
jgi:hypothetical protein